MTPTRLHTLVVGALSRPATRYDLDAWGPVLACPEPTAARACPLADCQHDDDADRALIEHRKTSPHAPTPADIRRLMTAYANDRHDRAVVAQLEAAREHAVPPTPEYLAARTRLAAAQSERDRELNSPLPDETDPERMAQARAELDALRPAPPPTPKEATP